MNEQYNNVIEIVREIDQKVGGAELAQMPKEIAALIVKLKRSIIDTDFTVKSDNVIKRDTICGPLLSAFNNDPRLRYLLNMLKNQNGIGVLREGKENNVILLYAAEYGAIQLVKTHDSNTTVKLTEIGWKLVGN